MAAAGGGGDLGARLGKYTAVALGTPDLLDALSPPEREAVALVVQAARLLDEVYLRQVWQGNADLRRRIQLDREQGKPGADLTERFFAINYGPWDRLDHDHSFVEGSPAKPPGANFYPEDLTKEEFEAWVATLAPEEQENARGFFHVVRRDQAGKLVLRSYAEEYKEWLEPAAALLARAADLVQDASLARFLKLRSEAFASNYYRDSDEAWLAVSDDSKLEITIGPYEVYEDSLFNYKAAFEAFVTIRDFHSTQQLKEFRAWMQELEDNLPIPEAMKNKELQPSPIVVVNEIFVGGDHAGPQTAAYNLPNDEQIKGSKLVILKNVQEAKFEKILKEIGKVVVREDQQQYLSFYTFFTHILLHEMSHSLGPHNLSSGSTVRKELQEFHSAIEEAKADIAGLFAVQYLTEKGRLDAKLQKSFYVTYMASAFRSIRFGLEEAHGKGQAVQLNYLIDQGGIEYDPKTETFAVNFDKIEAAVRDLSTLILVTQGNGDKPAAKKILEELGINRDYTQKALEKLSHIPVDIAPTYALFA